MLTLGRAMGRKDGGRENLLLSEEELRARGVEVVETNRGGDVTYHGPGQLVGYPIFDLRGPLRAAGKRLGPVDFVRQMEEALIRTMADYGVAAMRVPGRTGVWTQPGGTVEEKKIAAIGIHVSAGITSHGFALNVTTDLKDFEWIVPCGISDRAVTSLEQESRSQPGFDAADGGGAGGAAVRPRLPCAGAVAGVAGGTGAGGAGAHMQRRKMCCEQEL